MKTISRIAYLFAALSLALVSCQPKEDYEVGPKDDPNSYGVYFPVQDALKGLVKDPSEDTFDTIFVARTKSEGDITVPIEAIDETDSVFTVTPLVFEDGQDESFIVVSYPKAAVGTEYTLKLRISGDEYISKYSTNATVADFSVIRVLWKSLGTGLFTDNIWFNGYEQECEFQVRDDNHSFFRVKEPYKDAHDYYTTQGLGSPLDEWLTFRILSKGEKLLTVEITKDDLVYFDYYMMGFIHSSYRIPMEIDHPVLFGSTRSIDGISNNCVLAYQEENEDGDIYPATVQLAPFYYMEGKGGWNYSAEENGIVLYFPGVPKTDYTLEIETSEAESGVLPVYFTTGTDIDTVKYAVFEGTLSTGQVNSRANAIAADPDADFFAPTEEDLDEEDLVYYNTIGLTLDSTMTYTIVAVGKSEGEVVAVASGSFNYLKEGDDVPFVISASIESTDKYEALGEDYNSDNILSYYVYADSSVTTFIAAIYENKVFKKKAEDCWKDLASGSFSLAIDTVATKPELAQGLGLEGIEKGLTPGTEYALLVYASNGYKVQTISKIALTTGVAPLPIYNNYTYASANADLYPDSPDAFYGSYNLYAVDLFGESALRDYIGEAVIDTLDTSKYSPREEYYLAEYGCDVAWLTVSGFSGSVKENYELSDDEFDDNIVLGYARYQDDKSNECYLYVAEGVTADSLTTVYFCNKNGGINAGATDYLCGFPVDEGYIAFVYDGSESGAKYAWNGLAFFNASIDSQYILGAYKDYLLVDPKVDDNGVAPDRTIRTVKKAIKSVSNCVETPQGARKSKIEAIREARAVKQFGNNEIIKSEPKAVSVNASKLASKAVKGGSANMERKHSSAKNVKADKVRVSWQ
ncbi:MAG: hypothetical protein IJ686_01415 [Bacteroidales bacterium]|nr:hypothetical protein [Bacteroidales bacterium]